jgi:hypothetical protein
LGTCPIGDIKRSEIVRLLEKIEDESGPVMADRVLAIVRGMARTKPKERARKRTLTDDEIRIVWKIVAATLVVGEGLETMLSAMMRGYAPAWALGDAGSVAQFPVLADIKHNLTIIVDNDAAGQAAARECSRR